MTIRNNEDRVGAPIQDDTPVEQAVEQNDTFSFVTPTEFVELPTKGRFYPEDHPLHNQETLEIRYMTAKDEDILTSQSLLKKGIAIERLLQNVIVDKNIKIEDLYVGDKNAVIIATRITGYGSDYDVKITCPSCGENEDHSFNLKDVDTNYGDNIKDLNVEVTEDNTFIFNLPKSEVNVEVRLLTGQDERNLMLSSERRKKHKLPEATLTDQFKNMIVSVNGRKDSETVNTFINNMPAIDSKYLRGKYMRVVPNVDMTTVFYCSSCGAENEAAIPFTTDFFWPK
tara:strand:+ start:118 stop:969 length:852 start_codon:yes stop_codon:yes gene_type:complete